MRSTSCCFLTDVHSMGLDVVVAAFTSVVGWYWGLNDETRAFGHRFFELHRKMPTAPQAAVYSGLFSLPQSCCCNRLR